MLEFTSKVSLNIGSQSTITIKGSLPPSGGFSELAKYLVENPGTVCKITVAQVAKQLPLIPDPDKPSPIDDLIDEAIQFSLAKVNAEQDRISEAERERQERQETEEKQGQDIPLVQTEDQGGAMVRLCGKCCAILPGDSPIEEHVCEAPATAVKPTKRQRERTAKVAASEPPGPVELGANGHAKREPQKCAECGHVRNTHGRSGVCKTCGCGAFYLTSIDDRGYAPKDRGLKSPDDDSRFAMLREL
ncbi:MAG: hypothetical protein KGL39_55130, partial [Patescibacteria group bacterium]|nr:hypothetical protein [Patescibacteria group bacterium]